MDNALPQPFLVLVAHSLRQKFFSRKAGSSDHSSLVQMLVDIFSIRRIMKWVINENNVSRCLVCFPFNQIYTNYKSCRNYLYAAMKFVELQVRTFFSFIITFKQIFSDIGLSTPTCDK